MAFVYSVGLPKVLSVAILLAALTFFLLAEYARLKFPGLNRFAIKVMGPLMRTHEANQISGTPFYLGSVLLSIIVFSRPIAVLSILFLAIGDPVSSIFGILWGDKGIRFKNGKSLIGTAAGMGICAIITFCYLILTDVPVVSSACIALAGGLAGGGAEMIPLEIDDNFSIPLVSGITLWLAFLLFGV